MITDMYYDSTYDANTYKTPLNYGKTLLEAQKKCLIEYYKRKGYK